MLPQWELQPCRPCLQGELLRDFYGFCGKTAMLLSASPYMPYYHQQFLNANHEMNHQGPTGYAAVFWTVFWLVSDSCNHLTRRPSSQTPSTKIYAKPGMGEGHTAFFYLRVSVRWFRNGGRSEHVAASRYHAQALFQHHVKHKMAESPCFFSCARLTLELLHEWTLGQWACDSWGFT